MVAGLFNKEMLHQVHTVIFKDAAIIQPTGQTGRHYHMLHTTRYARSFKLSLLALLACTNVFATTNVCVRYPNGGPVNCVDSATGSGISSLGIQDEGVGIGTATTLNCAGAGVACAISNNIVTATISGAAVTLGGGLNAVQVNRPLASLGGEETVLSQNGTNVGIGTTNGKFLLDVEASAATYKSMFTVSKSSSDGATNVGIGTQTPGTRGLTMFQRVNQQLAFNMNSGGGSTSSARFTASNADSGNSLVFQVSSSGQAPLAGLASGTSALYYTAADLLPFFIGTHSSSDFGILTADVPFVYFTVGQNVGIGTVGPTQKLQVAGTILADTDVKIGANSVCQSNGTNCPAGGSSQFLTTSVGIGTTSNVGIGTITPLVKLVVQGNVGISTTLNNSALAVNGGATFGSTYAAFTPPDGTIAVQGDLGGNVGGVGIGTYNMEASNFFQINPVGNFTFAVNGSGVINRIGATVVNIASNALTWTLNGALSIGNNSTGGSASLKFTGGANDASFIENRTTGAVTSSGYQEWTGGNNGALKFMRMDSVGNLGIGTTTPQTKLSIMGGNVGIGTITAVNAQLETAGFRLMNNGVAAGNVLVSNSIGVGTWMPPATIGAGGGGGSGTVNSGIATFYGQYPSTGTTIDDSAVTMDNGTNVGIGTVTPTAKLNISTSAAQDLFRVDDNGIPDTTPFIIDATGNVGIGSANPSAALAISSTVNQALLRVDDNGTGDLSPFIVDANGNVGIGTANTETDKLLVMGGNVGIGTWIPSTALDVKGTIVQTGLQLTGNGAATGFVMQTNSVGVGTWVNANTLSVTATATPGGSSPQLQYNNAGAMGGITNFNSDGSNVGIGTTSFANSLGILGNVGIGTMKYDAYLTQVTSGGNLVIQGNIGIGTWKAGNSLIVSAVGAGNGGGNVGIGTLAPGVALDVNGTTRISGGGDSYIQGNLGLGTTIPMGTLAVQGSIVQGTVAYTGRAVDTNTVALSGNVGINTWNPLQQLLVVGNVGIGTVLSNTQLGGFSPASPGGQLYVQGNVGIGSNAPQSALTLGGNNHLGSTGTAPAVASNDCGSTAQGTIVAGSTDVRGQVTVGTLTVTSCAVTFNKAFGVAPICITQDDTNILGVKNTQTTTKLTITSTTSMSSDVVSWVCIE